MNFSFEVTPEFVKQLKKIAKKHPSIKNDILTHKAEIIKNPNLGIDLGSGFRKIRLKIKSKTKGKSGGARVVTLNVIENEDFRKIVFVTIWDKSDVESVSVEILKTLLL